LAFLASPTGPLGFFWRPDTSGFPEPQGGQLALLILLNLAEVLTFGLGVSFLLFGRPMIQGLLPKAKGLVTATHLSVAWILFSWWPHDSLHMAAGSNLNALIAIEYGFHITVMLAGVALAAFFGAILRQSTTKAHRS
jgi:hypothetical protein